MLEKLNHYLAKVCTFLITAALIAGMVSCDGVQYNLTMAVAPVGSGTATDLTNASPYTAGTVVSIKAVANTGYEFVNWTAPAGTFGNATAATTTFTMPAQNVAITANFALVEIRTWYDLDAIRDNPGGFYLLMNDLDSTTLGYEELASSTANQGKGWDPIGTVIDAEFTGTFDGQGYEIRDLYINRPSESYVGLFSWLGETGVIKNIGMVNVTIAGNYWVGGLVGANEGTVSNSCSTGRVIGNIGVGGLMGGNQIGIVNNSYSSGNVTGDEYVGGLAGGNQDSITSNSSATGNVTGNVAVGGLVGFNINNINYEGTMSNCYATGRVTGGSGVGGLVGANYACPVSDSYATGSVTGDQYVGGLMGGNEEGGIVSNSYSTGNVTGNLSVGGLVGGNSGTVSNSFWDIETSGQATSDGGTGKNTTEMQYIATFSDASWNITTVALNETNLAYIWNIVDNVTYPFLSWQT